MTAMGRLRPVVLGTKRQVFTTSAYVVVRSIPVERAVSNLERLDHADSATAPYLVELLHRASGMLAGDFEPRDVVAQFDRQIERGRLLLQVAHGGRRPREIETRPVQIGHGIVDESGKLGRVGRQVAFVFQDALELAREKRVVGGKAA